MARITIEAKLAKKIHYTKSFGWQTTEMTIYKFVDAAGKIYVWNTSAVLGMEVEIPWESKTCYLIDEDKHKKYDWIGVQEGDTVKITAAVKGESEYKGEKQTELQRVKVAEIIERAADLKAQKKAEREAQKQAQLDSISGGDFIWEMPYKQYKEHYADCETVIDSYEDHIDRYGFVTAPPTIKVIIREGRLKASGTRGRHYAGHRIQYELDGKTYVEPFRAVSEATAIRQAKKEHPTAKNFSCVEIIHYTHKSDWY